MVGPITATDVLNRSLGVATVLSSGLLQNEMFNAAPPGRAPDDTPSSGGPPAAATPAGSNAYAFGRERTGGSGLLLGNPHFFWDGPDR
ncbi:penicillin acylase family protein, partial [Stenotrophomonas maltophilia]|uniref:penicillin acylase family protein n=1 Tax=Stenotrophomonas maltophilia TaxID=40324 RepID=UPI001954FBEE